MIINKLNKKYCAARFPLAPQTVTVTCIIHSSRRKIKIYHPTSLNNPFVRLITTLSTLNTSYHTLIFVYLHQELWKQMQCCCSDLSSFLSLSPCYLSTFQVYTQKFSLSFTSFFFVLCVYYCTSWVALNVLAYFHFVLKFAMLVSFCQVLLYRCLICTFW